MILKCLVIINGSYVEINIFFIVLIIILWVFICMSYVIYYWIYFYIILIVSMVGRVVNFLICVINSWKVLVIIVIRGVVGVGVIVNDIGGKYVRVKYYNNLRVVLL